MTTSYIEFRPTWDARIRLINEFRKDGRSLRDLVYAWRRSRTPSCTKTYDHPISVTQAEAQLHDGLEQLIFGPKTSVTEEG